MRKCSEQHSCISSIFLSAILNGTCFFHETKWTLLRPNIHMTKTNLIIIIVPFIKLVGFINNQSYQFNTIQIFIFFLVHDTFFHQELQRGSGASSVESAITQLKAMIITPMPPPAQPPPPAGDEDASQQAVESDHHVHLHQQLQQLPASAVVPLASAGNVTTIKIEEQAAVDACSATADGAHDERTSIAAAIPENREESCSCPGVSEPDLPSLFTRVLGKGNSEVLATSSHVCWGKVMARC